MTKKIITCNTCRRTSQAIILTKFFKKPVVKCGLCNSTSVRTASEDEAKNAIEVKPINTLKIFAV